MFRIGSTFGVFMKWFPWAVPFSKTQCDGSLIQGNGLGIEKDDGRINISAVNILI